MRQLLRWALLLVAALPVIGCAEKSYVHYLIDPEVLVDESTMTLGEEPLRPSTTGGERAMTVKFNDGKMFTEVQIPLLSSGQRVLIKGASGSDVKTPAADPGVAPLPPGPNDVAHKTLRDAYLAKGYPENPEAPDASLSKTRIVMQQAMSQGNYLLALKHVENVLARYPSHPEFMRAKGTVLLFLGEREKAVQTYEAAQALEFDPVVERKLKELERQE